MKLNPAQREQVRLSILRYCATPCTAGIIQSYLVAEGFRVDREQVDLEVVYLSDKKLLMKTEKFISPENPLFRTTADGRDFLATSGNEQ